MMALRVMQIYLPKAPGGDTDEILEGRRILGKWRDSETDQVVLHLLIPAEETEPIMDRFEERYSNVEGFHVVLFPVEAALPRPKEEKKEVAEEIADEVAAVKDENGNGDSADRISREELYHKVVDGLGITRVFVGMAALSAIVAAVGLIRDDVAVVIGAMVIAPLLGPNVAMSLGATLGDVALFRRALATNVVGILTVFFVAVAIGLLFRSDASIPSIASRTDPSLGDIALALAAGSAGTLAFTRGLSGAVIGVMVAVALVPPLVVFGMMLGNGHWASAIGALLLTSANVVCINLAGVATFLVQGVRPRNWWEAERAKRAVRRAVIIWLSLLLVLIIVLWLA